MKKFAILMLFGACLAMASADDAGEIYSTIVNVYAYELDGNFEKSFSFYTPDAVLFMNGKQMPVAQVKRMVSMFDRKNPLRFWEVITEMENELGVPEEQSKKWREILNDPQKKKKMLRNKRFLASHKKICDDFYAKMAEGSKKELQTLKFLGVEIHGEEAVAIVEFFNVTQKQMKRSQIFLRKTEGAWKIYEER